MEEDEAYDFVREIRGTLKEAYQLIDDYCHPESKRDSALGSTIRSQATEMSERTGTRSRISSGLPQTQMNTEMSERTDTRSQILNNLQKMQIIESEERQRLMQL